MALQVGAACYGTPQEAAQAVAAGEVGRVVPAGSVVYVVDAVADASGSITYTLSDTAGVSPNVVYVAAPTFAPCGLLDTGDALAMSWGVAAAWLLTYAVLSVRKGLT